MRLTIAAATLMMIQLLPATWARSQSVFQAAYEEKQVFKLRTEVTGAATAPPFYKGAIEAAANQISMADKVLHSVINTAPISDQAYEAHDLLGNMYFRNGLYRAAFGEIRAALQERPDASDAKQMLPIATAVNNLPEMKVMSLRPSTLHIQPKSIFLPLQVNGHDAEFFFDTGAGISIIGESKAKQLGIPAEAVEGTLGDASGKGVSGLRIALAKDLVVGGLHLQNVPFVVLSDTGEPWNTLSLNRRGIIGIPVLLAMKSIRWKPTGSFELGFVGTGLNLSTCNVLFRNANPVIDVQASAKHLDFTLDTGAVTTDLNPAFAKACQR